MSGTSLLDRLRRHLVRYPYVRRPAGWGTYATTTAAFLAVAAGLLRLYRLGHESLWLDEAASVSFVTREYTTLQLLVEVPLNHTNPPLYFLLLDGWVALFGAGEAAVRFPSALLGAAAVGLTYLLGRELYDRSAGLVAAALLAVSSLHVHYSQEARTYSLLAALTLASYLLLVRVLDGDEPAPGRRTVAGYVLSTALLGYTHVYGYLVILAQNLYVVPLLVSSGRRPRPGGGTDRRFSLRSWLGVQSVVGALVAPYVLALVTRLGSFSAGEGTRISWIPEPELWDLATILRSYVVFPPGRAALGGSVTPTGALSVGAILLALGLAAVPIARFTFGNRGGGTADDRTPMVVLWLLTPLLGGYLVSILVTPILQPHYTIPSAVALFLLTGAGASQARSLPSPRGWNVPLGGHHLAVGLLLVAMAVPLPGYYAQDQKEQWREAVADVGGSAGPGALVVVSESYTVKPYRYYADRVDLDVVPMDDEASHDRVEAAADGHDEAWVLLSHAPEGAVLEHLTGPAGNWTVVDRETYVGIRLHELLRSG